MIIAVYIPRRKATKDRKKAYLSIGIGSKLGNKHLIFLEIDSKNYFKPIIWNPLDVSLTM
jgi:hypothetical protein